MPEITTLYAAEPLSISATFDKLWVREIVISAPDIGGEAEARITLERFRSTSDGVVEAAPGEPIRLRVGNLLAAAEADEALAAAVTAIMAYVGKVGIEQGVVAAPEV
jgi:hypothetical protein